MSLFRRERVFASVELDRVALVRLAKDGTAREEALIPVQLDAARPAEALRAVDAALAAPAWRDTARNVVLTDRLLRYVVSPRPAGIRSRAELKAACEARFEASFERPGTEWEIVVDMQPFARHDLACGMARPVADALRASFAASGSLASMRPYLVCELDRLARRVPAMCWFVAAARDCMTIAGIAGGECRLVRVLSVAHVSVSAIRQALDRESLLADDVPADAPILVAGVVQGDIGAAGMRRADASSWGTQPAAWANDFRLALAERWA